MDYTTAYNLSQLATQTGEATVKKSWQLLVCTSEFHERYGEFIQLQAGLAALAWCPR